MDFDWKINGNQYQATREGYNLLDFNVAQDKKVTVNEDGTITINGSGGFDIKFKEFVYKKGVTYKIKTTLVSGTYTGSDPRHVGIMTPYGDNEWLANNIFRTYTFLEDKVSSGMWTDAACVFNNATFEIYSYEGTEDKPYEPYGASPSPDYPSEIETVSDSVKIDVLNNDNTKSQSVIMPIQQEMLEGDYVADVEHHEWEKIVLTGNEDGWTYETNKNEKWTRFARYNLNIDVNSNYLTKSICSHFKIFEKYASIKNSFGIGTSNMRFNADSFIFVTVEEWKTYLKQQYEAGTPVTIYYKLATPVDLELTSEQKAVRNQKLYTYKNITNIAVSDELASIDVTYKKDLETMFNNIIKQIPSSASDKTET